MSAKFNLRYERGNSTAFIDLRTGWVQVYGPQTADFIHRNYGGEQYYKSQSGRSGAGWIENRPYIVRCDTLRTDIGIPKPLGGKVLNDFNVIVPVNGDYDCSSHGIFLVKGERVWYVDQH